MEWEFSPEDVVKARADYGLDDFRGDLAEEVRANLDDRDEAGLRRAFDLIYDLCYALATDRGLEEHLAAYAYDPPTCDFLRRLAPAMAANAAMLGAILQRRIMDHVEGGLPLEQAVAAVAEWHGGRVDGRMC